MYIFERLDEQRDIFIKRVNTKERELYEVNQFIKDIGNNDFMVPETVVNILKYSKVWIYWELEQDEKRLKEIELMLSLGMERVPRTNWSPIDGFSKGFQEKIIEKQRKIE